MSIPFFADRIYHLPGRSEKQCCKLTFHMTSHYEADPSHGGECLLPLHAGLGTALKALQQISTRKDSHYKSK